MCIQLYQTITRMTCPVPRAQSCLSPLVEDQVSIIVSNALSEVDIRVVFLAIDVAQDSAQNRDTVVTFAVESHIVGTGVEVTAVPVEVS